jgi:hypothetical protein
MTTPPPFSEALDERTDTRPEAAAMAADLVRELIRQLQDEGGMPTDAVLAGAHAEIVTAITARYGGPAAAMWCARAAEKVRHMPSEAAFLLARATPSGSA